MKYAAPARKEIATRTIFNILGPLSNPAGAASQLVGVYDDKLTEVLANVLENLGLKRAFVVHGMDGLDEITVTEKTKISELKSGRVRTYFITPEEFGMKKASLDQIKGGSKKENADIVLSILKGEAGPRRDIVLLNAAAAIVAGFKTDDFKKGIELAKISIDSGAALEKLKKFIEFTKL